MEKSKHTPGPWTIGYGGMEGDNYAIIISPFRKRAICNLEPHDYTPENARLISAAPELLEACKSSLPFLEVEDKRRLPENLAKTGCPLTQLVRSAIAKAEGK